MPKRLCPGAVDYIGTSWHLKRLSPFAFSEWVATEVSLLCCSGLTKICLTSFHKSPEEEWCLFWESVHVEREQTLMLFRKEDLRPPKGTVISGPFYSFSNDILKLSCQHCFRPLTAWVKLQALEQVLALSGVSYSCLGWRSGVDTTLIWTWGELPCHPLWKLEDPLPVTSLENSGLNLNITSSRWLSPPHP